MNTDVFSFISLLFPVMLDILIHVCVWSMKCAPSIHKVNLLMALYCITLQLLHIFCIAAEIKKPRCPLKLCRKDRWFFKLVKHHHISPEVTEWKSGSGKDSARGCFSHALSALAAIRELMFCFSSTPQRSPS